MVVKDDPDEEVQGEEGDNDEEDVEQVIEHVVLIYWLTLHLHTHTHTAVTPLCMQSADLVFLF